MLDKIKKILEQAANEEINIHSEAARAKLAREIILTIYGEQYVD